MNTQDEMHITKVVVDARRAAGMTQMQLSKKTGVSQCDISRIETGLANPSVKTLKRLAEGLDMTLKIELLYTG